VQPQAIELAERTAEGVASNTHCLLRHAGIDIQALENRIAVPNDVNVSNECKTLEADSDRHRPYTASCYRMGFDFRRA
jgi:hypothetical protein